MVGVPTLAASDPQMGGAAAGIGFAIPGNIARDLASQIIRYGRVIDSHRAFLGIESADLSAGGGALVYSTVAGGPAAKAGLKAGDIITAVDGQPAPSVGALAAVLAGLKPGQKVPVDVTHQDGSQSTVRVTLGQLPGVNEETAPAAGAARVPAATRSWSGGLPGGIVPGASLPQARTPAWRGCRT